MATFTSTSGSYTTTLTVNQTSQSTQNNQSTLTYSLTLTKNSGTGLWNNNSCPYSISIDGSVAASGSFTYDFRGTSAGYTITLKGSTTTTVNHNSDGTKTVACSASVNMDNEPYVYVMNPSGDLTLTTIPRASDVSVSNYSIANTTGSISATITSKANFYHKWRWQMNDGTWSAWANKGLISSTTSTVTVANTTLLAQLPSATSGSFNIEVATYSDSGYTTLIGTKSATATVSVNTSNIKPSVSLGNIGLNSSPISGYAVAGYSKVQSAWTTTNSSGASGVTTYFTTSHGSLATTSSTSTSGTTVSGVIPSASANYTLTLSAYAKDSRGAQSSTVSKTITVYGYTPPTATLTAYRVASSSSTTEDGAGTYAYVTFSGAVGASVNGQNTIQSTTCTYSGSISGTATSGGHYALADTQTVTFTVTVTDKVTSSTAQKTISTAIYALDLYDDGQGHVGVGLGAIAQSDKIVAGLPIEVRGSVKANSLHSAHIFTRSGSSGYVKIRINSLVNWMLSFTVCIYANYNQIQLRVSGYNYFTANQHWYLPRALLLSTSELVNLSVTFGYDTDDYLWVCIPVGNYYGVDIVDVTNGHYQVIDTVDELFTLTEVLSIPTTVQATVTATLSAITSTNANNVYVTATNPTSATTYYVPFHSGVGTGNKALCDNNGLAYTTLEGTASALGYSAFVLGNTTPYGTAENKYGRLFIHDRYTHRVDLRTTNNMSANRVIQFPDKDGTLAIEDVKLWTGSLTGTNSIDLDISGYKRIRIYAQYATTQQTIWEIDVTKLHATTQYRCNHCELSWLDTAWFHTIFELSASKARITLNNVYNMNISGTTFAQNNSTAYQIYQIDGIL